MRILKHIRITLCATMVVAAGFIDAALAKEAPSAPAARHEVVGSWLVTYDVPAFGDPFALLLTLGDDGTGLETDAPGKFPLGPDFFVILSNGHGAWTPAHGRNAFAFVYRKLIFLEDGLTAFGITRTRATGSVSRDGATFSATVDIEIADATGQVLFVAQGTASGSKISVE